jgi:hypothetical protein
MKTQLTYNGYLQNYITKNYKCTMSGNFEPKHHH